MQKDYEKPYFNDYRQIVDEFEKIPPSELQTKCLNMLHRLYEDMCNSIEMSEKLYQKDTEKSLRLFSFIRRCFYFNVFVGHHRLRDEGLRLLDEE